MSTLTKKRTVKRAPLPNSLRRLPHLTKIPRIPKCTVATCFTDEQVFARRNAAFDTLLPATLPASKPVSVLGHQLTKVVAEAEMLKVGRPLTNLKQIEDLILRTEKGENTNLITNGYTNLFFLQVGASVFTVRASRYGVGWGVRLRRFLAGREWRDEYRFFSLAT